MQAKLFLTFATAWVHPSCTTCCVLHSPSSVLRSGQLHLIATTTFIPKSSLWLGAGVLGLWQCGTNGFSKDWRNDFRPLPQPQSSLSLIPPLLPGCCSSSGHPPIFQHFRNKIFNNLPRLPLSASTFKLPSGRRGQ